MAKKIKIQFVDSRTTAPEESCLQILNLTLNPVQTLALTGGPIFLGGNCPDTSMSLKSCYSRQLLLSLVFILSHAVRFLLDLINQYYSLLPQNLHTC